MVKTWQKLQNLGTKVVLEVGNEDDARTKTKVLNVTKFTFGRAKNEHKSTTKTFCSVPFA